MLESLQSLNDDILTLQKDQLFAGLSGSGDLLSPKYSDDPFFKTKESALRYAARKDKIKKNILGVFGDRPFDVPNLFVNGKLFHDYIKVKLSEDYIEIDAYSSPIIAKLEAKYGKDLLGLSEEAKKYLLYELLLPVLNLKLEEYGVRLHE